MKHTGLMKQVRAHLALNPALTTDGLMKLIAPSFPGYSPVWLRKRVNHYRWSITRMARIKAEIFNNDTDA